MIITKVLIITSIPEVEPHEIRLEDHKWYLTDGLSSKEIRFVGELEELVSDFNRKENNAHPSRSES